MAHTGKVTFWNRGSPLAPSNTNLPTTQPDRGSQSYWQYGSPLLPSAFHGPTYGEGTYGGSGGTYGALTPYDTYATDYFDRTVALSGNLGGTVEEGVWVDNTGGSWSLDGDYLTTSVGSGIRRHIFLTDAITGNVTVTTPFKFGALPSSNTVSYNLILRKISATTWYIVQVNVYNTGQVNVRIQKTTNGGSSLSDLTDVDGLHNTNYPTALQTFNGTDELTLVASISGSKISARLYRTSDGDPGSMQAAATDSTITQGGEIGFTYDNNDGSGGSLSIKQILAYEGVPWKNDIGTGTDASTQTVHFTGAGARTDSAIGDDSGANHVVNNFDTGQTTGTTISVANSKSTGNDGFGATAGAPKYSSVQAHSGTLSMLANDSTNGEVRYTGLALTEIWTRSHFYFQSVVPIGNTQIVSVLDETTSGIARVSFLTSGVLQAIGISSSNFSTAMQTGQWYRIETHAVISAGTLTHEVRLYLADSDTLLEQKTASGATAHTSFSTVDYGVAGSGFQTLQPYVDDVGYSTSGWMGRVIPLSTLAAKYIGADARTDSATGTDASTISKQFTVTDTGTGTDASSEHAAYPRTDAASGTDASTERATFARSDTSTGSDASTASAAFSRTDTGTGTDASVQAARASGSDTGTSESTSAVTAAYSLEDSATGTDASTLTKDSGDKTLNLSDSGEGTDESALAATGSGSDDGSGSSNSSLAAAYDVEDTAVGTDTARVIRPSAIPAVIWQDGAIKVWLSGTDMTTAIYEPALDPDPSAFFVAT